MCIRDRCQGDAIKKVRKNAKKYDLVVCSGGDGTLDEVVTGMEQSEVNVPIGYIPAGSTLSLIHIFVGKIPVEKVIETAKKTLYTGHIGDGKIFVYDVAQVVKVRPGA